MGSSTSPFGQIHLQFKGCLVWFLTSPLFLEISVLNANSVDLRQNAASDLLLYCLLFLGTLGINWLKGTDTLSGEATTGSTLKRTNLLQKDAN